MNATPHTTLAGEDLAVSRLRGDWDEEGTISVHLPAEAAEILLESRGWQHAHGGGWTSPGARHFWHTSEALTVALIAEIA